MDFSEKRNNNRRPSHSKKIDNSSKSSNLPLRCPPKNTDTDSNLPLPNLQSYKLIISSPCGKRRCYSFNVKTDDCTTGKSAPLSSEDTKTNKRNQLMGNLRFLHSHKRNIKTTNTQVLPKLPAKADISLHTKNNHSNIESLKADKNLNSSYASMNKIRNPKIVSRRKISTNSCK